MDPLSHSESRNPIEAILKYIPGFRGYLQREYRRESDALVRKHMDNCLQNTKQSVDRFARVTIDKGLLEHAAQADRIKNAIDTLQNRMRSAVRGYSAVFDYVRVQREELDRVLQLDLQLSREAEKLQAAAAALGEETTSLTGISDSVAELSSAYDQRRQILEGLAEET